MVNSSLVSNILSRESLTFFPKSGTSVMHRHYVVVRDTQHRSVWLCSLVCRFRLAASVLTRSGKRLVRFFRFIVSDFATLASSMCAGCLCFFGRWLLQHRDRRCTIVQALPVSRPVGLFHTILFFIGNEWDKNHVLTPQAVRVHLARQFATLVGFTEPGNLMKGNNLKSNLIQINTF